jgi:hypothetical protein
MRDLKRLESSLDVAIRMSQLLDSLVMGTAWTLAGSNLDIHGNLLGSLDLQVALTAGLPHCSSLADLDLDPGLLLVSHLLEVARLMSALNIGAHWARMEVELEEELLS